MMAANLGARLGGTANRLQLRAAANFGAASLPGMPAAVRARMRGCAGAGGHVCVRARVLLASVRKPQRTLNPLVPAKNSPKAVQQAEAGPAYWANGGAS